MNNFSELQKEIIEAKDKNICVLSSPATGKTAILTGRVKYLLENGVDLGGIVVFNFTNAAAEEMRKRIGDIGKNCFINTVHAYAYYLLVKNGIDTSSAINEEDFDEFFHLIQLHPEVIEPVEYLLLDEAQDSNLSQFQFILKMIKPEHCFIVGDLKQSIYCFDQKRPARPDILAAIANDSQFTLYELNENYRNGPSILRFAKRIIRGNLLGDDYELYDNSVCMNSSELDYVTEVEYRPSYVINFIKDIPPFGSWFILARKNEQVDDIVSYLTRAEIPCDTFKRSQITSEEFIEKMNRDTVKVLTVHSAKGLEADNVMVVGVGKWARDPQERRVAYVAATRARKRLIWMKSVKKKPRNQVWE